MDWRDLIDPIYPKDIQTLEHQLSLYFQYYQCKSSEPKEPCVTVVSVNDTRTLAVLWHTEDGKRMIFPILEPSCPEAEYIHPCEWQAIFIGTAAQLAETVLNCRLDVPPADSPGKIFCLLTLRKMMTGFDGRDMSHLVFPCPMVTRVERGEVFNPRTFCFDGRQPPIDLVSFSFFQCCHHRPA